jgi:hypothetical protein
MLVVPDRYGMKDKDLVLKNLPFVTAQEFFTPEKRNCKRNLLSYIPGMTPMFYLIPLKSPLACQVHGNKMMWGESTYTVC